MVLTLLTEVRRLRTLIAARNIEGERAALAAEESLQVLLWPRVLQQSAGNGRG